jgi:CheY-like chemotaxis protein
LAPQRIELALAPVWVDADSGRIVQIVENLVDNALKHTSATRRIRVTVAAVGDSAELRVEDEGRGIEPELLPRVFEPFMQGAQGLDRSAGGLGLGLTLVRRLTELHGGTIAARSGGENGGSGFTLRFPRLAATACPPGAAEPRPDPQAAQRCRILVIEDNDDARITLRAYLEALGHEVHDASDGESGVAAASALDPDIVFVDIGLPRVDGYEVARRLRKEGAERPRLVALTGYGREADVRRAREAGFDEHLLKPAGAERLQAVLGRLAPARPA